MRYVRMTADQYALYQRANGLKVKKVAGNWWAEVRPFFFRPLIPFTEISPLTMAYPVKSIIGGCLHAVPKGSSGNSKINLFIYDDIQNYDLGQLNEKHRYITRKGIKNFTARQFTDLGQFTEEAYDIYVSFYNRTGYQYGKERLDRDYFRKWAGQLFENQRLLIIGAYREGKLSAIDISCWVEDLIIDDVFFSDTESQSLKVTDFLLHTIREAAVSSDASYIFRGLPSGHQTLDESKITRGCKILQKPALLRLNPVAQYGAKLFMKSSYNKLLGITTMFSGNKAIIQAGA